MGSGSSTQTPALKKAVEVQSLKIAVVGDPLVGKTSILTRYIHNQFSPVYVQTHKAAIENVVRKLNVPGHAKVPVTLWDIPGYEDLPLHESYFRDLDAVIVVVDMSSPESLESATVWRQSVMISASFSTNEDETVSKQKEQGTMVEEDSLEGANVHTRNIEDIPFLLLGNKLDLCMTQKPEDNDDINAPETAEKKDVEKETIDMALLLSDRVTLLEQIADSGFIGSIAVSARNNDLSVHAAIQNFLRYLLEKKNNVQRRWIPRPSAINKEMPSGRPRYKKTQQLSLVGILEIDVKFSEAEEILYRVDSLQRYQDDSLAKFFSQCVDIGMVSDQKDASMQNCLVALRDKMAELDLKLQLKVDEEFCHLEVKASKENAELDKDIRYAVKTFNKEYAAVTRAMLAEFPIARTKLIKIESDVDKLCETQKDQPPTLSSSSGPPRPSTPTRSSQAAKSPSENIKVVSLTAPEPDNLEKKDDRVGLGVNFGGMRIGAMIERNRAMLRHAAHECNDCLIHIQRSVKQAKAAFVW